MEPSPPPHLRVHLYGTQGSGSVFPGRAERQAFQRQSTRELLTKVFDDLARRTNDRGELVGTVADILGGPPTSKNLLAYADRFELTEPRVYGGWTTCLWIETGDGFDIVLDCGSGFRNCARDLQAKWGTSPERHLYLFGSHSHLDHTEGFDQAAVCFDPRNHLHIFGNHQFLRALDFNLGIFSRRVARDVQGVQTPIFFGVMPATFVAREIGHGTEAEARVRAGHQPLNAVPHDISQPVRIGDTTITAFEVFHPAPCLGYRIENGGRVMVFCTDHELRHGTDQAHPDEQRSRDAEARLIQHATGADLLYRDGQYLRAEYDGVKGVGDSGAISRVGWGHSCVEDVVDMAIQCGVKHTLIGHHDPNREWAERNWLDESMARRTAGTAARIELARAETVFEL